METVLSDGVLTIFLPTIINAENSGRYGKELEEEISKYPDADWVFDADNMEYISSSGLRILFKIAHLKTEKVPIINVSKFVFSVLDMTGFTTLMEVRKKMEEISIEDCEMTGAGECPAAEEEVDE